MQSGSYYLARDLGPAAADTDGITITTDNVTLDLNGFALIGPGKEVGTSGDGIYVSTDCHSIDIQNGAVTNWRDSGIEALAARDSRISEMRCRQNGGYGIGIGPGALVESCVASDNGLYGIVCPSGPANIRGNLCSNNGIRGISGAYQSVVVNNTCTHNALDGFAVGSGSTIIANVNFANGDAGFEISNACIFQQNTSRFNDGNGFRCNEGCLVTNNVLASNGTAEGDFYGIFVEGSNNRVVANHVVAHEIGIALQAAGNVVSENSCLDNATPLQTVAGNQLDILISALPYTITHPGHYTVTGDLSVPGPGITGISISADDVTLDLGGHALIGPGKESGGGEDGIRVSAAHYNLTIRNGTVRAWPGEGDDGDGAGVHVLEHNNHLEHNTVIGNDRGIDVDGPYNYIASTRARNSGGVNYDIAAFNTEGTGDLANISF